MMVLAASDVSQNLCLDTLFLIGLPPNSKDDLGHFLESLNLEFRHSQRDDACPPPPLLPPIAIEQKQAPQFLATARFGRILEG